MGLENFHKGHFIERLEALQKNLNEIISASKIQGQPGYLFPEGSHDSTSEISCILDLYGRLIHASPGFTSAFGHSLEIVANHSILELISLPRRKACGEYLEKLRSGFPMVKFETPFRCANGTVKNIQWKGTKKEGYLYMSGTEEVANATGALWAPREAPVLPPVKIAQSLEGEKMAGVMNTTSGLITFVNDYWLQTLGYSQTEVIGRSYSAFFKEEEISQSFRYFTKTAGEAGPFKGVMYKKNGEKILISYTGSSSMQNTFSWFIFFNGVNIDKPARSEPDGRVPEVAAENKENKNRELSFSAEQNLRAIINSGNQILFLIDKNLKIITYNKHAREIVTKRVEKKLLTGDSFLNFIPRADIGSFKEIFTDVLKGNVTHLSQELNFKTSKRWFEVHIQPVKDDTGSVSCVVISAEDITDKKIAGEKFKELEINFKSIFSQVAVGIMLFNVDLESEQANRRFYEMIEYTPDEYKELGPVELTHPDDREITTKKVADLITGKVSHYSIEKRFVTKSGKIIWVLLTATLVKNRLGKPKHIISVIQDITPRKTAEQELIYKKNELDTFVYRASHDLRGPVASLMGLYNIVKREFEHNAEALNYFQHYNNSVMRLHAVLQNLIDLTKIKESETKLTQVDIREMIAGCIEQMSELQHFHRIKFIVEVDLDFKVFIDGKRFQTIIKSLVENSIMYCTPEDKAFIKIKVNYQENVLKMEISDNGRGIHPKVQSKVFNMFFRGTEVSSGSGLGLYIVKNAVEKLNGSIQLTSQLNEGTKVSVYIPYLYEQEYTSLLEKNFIN